MVPDGMASGGVDKSCRSRREKVGRSFQTTNHACIGQVELGLVWVRSWPPDFIANDPNRNLPVTALCDDADAGEPAGGAVTEMSDADLEAYDRLLTELRELLPKDEPKGIAGVSR
jgi:hypothetical protein